MAKRILLQGLQDSSLHFLCVYYGMFHLNIDISNKNLPKSK